MADKPQGISLIGTSGIKSLYGDISIEVKPLTILAGANSSGKSSIMQPVLLLKQTLEAEYDAGGFIWDGHHVKIIDPIQFLNDSLKASNYFDSEAILELAPHIFACGIYISEKQQFTFVHAVDKNGGSAPIISVYENNEKSVKLQLGQSSETIKQELGEDTDALLQAISNYSTSTTLKWRNHVSRGFLQPAIVSDQHEQTLDIGNFNIKVFPIGNLKRLIQEIIHIPGLRGNPKRQYPVTTMDFSRFEGTFLPYTASVIHHWQQSDREEDKTLIEKLCYQLKSMNLTANVATRIIDNTQIEVRVGRTLNSAEDDTVSLADVGFGVSQVLPVLVALLVAKPGQLVYLEQPELHLHPRAQVALAQILADAANRGVRVVVETHSSLLLIGIQTLIAEGKLKPDDTILHWFTRGEDGKTTVDSQIPDENGAYGDWPEDFADVELHAQGAYLDAVARRQLSTEAGD